MQEYLPLPNALRLPQAVTELFTGRLTIVPAVEQPPDLWYGFPPAFVPVWSEYDSHMSYGLWTHWFATRRQRLCFVSFSAEGGYFLEEIGRAFEQVGYFLVLYALNFYHGLEVLEGKDVEIDPEIIALAEGLNLRDWRQLTEIVRVSGDDPVGLRNHPAFADDPPLVCCPRGEGYRGDFPHVNMEVTEEDVRHICPPEIAEDALSLLERIRSLPFASPWFTSTRQPDVFYPLLEAGDYNGAWMSLNSPGWLYTEANEAIRELGRRVNDPTFDLLVHAWTSQSFDYHKY